MTLHVDNKGTIFIHQGDSGELTVNGLSTDNDYRIYFAVRNKKRESVGDELVVNSNYNESVTFNLTSDFTDLFVVNNDDNFAIYHYGLKMCTDTTEDTLFVANTTYGQLNNIVVFPKFVEGYYE